MFERQRSVYASVRRNEPTTQFQARENRGPVAKSGARRGKYGLQNRIYGGAAREQMQPDRLEEGWELDEACGFQPHDPAGTFRAWAQLPFVGRWRKQKDEGFFARFQYCCSANAWAAMLANG